MYAGCLYVADSCNSRVQVTTNSGRFLRLISVDYCPAHIAVRADGRLLVCGYAGHRVELMTLFGSLLQVVPYATASL